MSLRLGRNGAAFVHLTLVPFIPSAGELKTKPTQHSVQKLREIGIYPNALLCRADREVPEDERAKISLFSNVPLDAVISVWDADSIYHIPPSSLPQKLYGVVCEARPIPPPPAGRPMGAGRTEPLHHPQHEVQTRLFAKHVHLAGSY